MRRRSRNQSHGVSARRDFRIGFRVRAIALALLFVFTVAASARASQFCEAPLTESPPVLAEAPRDPSCVVDALPLSSDRLFLADVSDLPNGSSSWILGAHKLRIPDLGTKRWIPRDGSLLVLGGGLTRAADERLCARLVEAGFDEAQVLRGGVLRAVRALGLGSPAARRQEVERLTAAAAFEGVERGTVEMIETASLLGEDGALRIEALARYLGAATVERPLLLAGSEADYARIGAVGALPPNAFFLEGGPDAYRIFRLDRAYADASRGGSLQRCAAPY